MTTYCHIHSFMPNGSTPIIKREQQFTEITGHSFVTCSILASKKSQACAKNISTFIYSDH